MHEVFDVAKGEPRSKPVSVVVYLRSIASGLAPDVTESKVYFAQDGSIQVHQSRVAPCPTGFPSGYYWYGIRRHSPGRPPKWVQNLLQDDGPEEVPMSGAGEEGEPSEGDPRVGDNEADTGAEGDSEEVVSLDPDLASGEDRDPEEEPKEQSERVA